VTWPAPSREAHNSFCLIEGWTPTRDAKGKKVGHHLTYELTLPDARVLRTRVSKSPNKDTYGPDMWSHILRDQLQVDDATFWACVQHKTKPDRGAPKAPAETVPADLAHLLVVNLRVAEAEIQGMTKQEAIELISKFWRGETE
jgi:hypothetical protein